MHAQVQSSAVLFDDAGRFIIEDYPAQKPFSSFLPGIAGRFGIPMWVFYTNRAQIIAGFGVESKDSPIMEFQPANKAYRATAYTGFRTFIKVGGAVFEPFSPLYPGPQRDMFIGLNEVEIQERAPQRGLQTNARYFTLSDEPFAGLVRQLTVTNTSGSPVELELLDGLPAIMPYGLNDWFTKMMARTAEAWLEVFNVSQRVPFYRTRASIVDKSEVEGVEAGHFYLAFHEHDGRSHLLQPIVDPSVVFGRNTALTHPDGFKAADVATLLTREQITVGKTPCGFFGTDVHLEPGESFTLYSVIGHVNTVDILNQEVPRIADAAYLQKQHATSQAITQTLTDTIAVKTGQPVFDAYTRQTFLDNVLRGGWPMVLGEGRVYHVYSRKHGDMERDYNAFFLAAEPFSQGNGNFRDVNQNRREDVWLNPAVGDFNIRMFMNLIQADGYNPLVVHGSTFTLPDEARADVVELVTHREKLVEFLSGTFTPGQLLTFLAVNAIDSHVSREELIHAVFSRAEQTIESSFHEGYWVDHWTYNLDLVENYLAIYPDREAGLLFGTPEYTFYDSPAVVQPRHEKYVLANGSPRQFNAVTHDEEKAALIAARQAHPHVVRTQHGHGEIYRTTLIAKLLHMAVIKMATRDPQGMGIEMEADKPGWYDAINGLPGLFGSSMPETFELLRLVMFLQAAVEKQREAEVSLPVEVATLLDVIRDEGDYWAVTAAREAYREQTRLGFDGEERILIQGELLEVLGIFQDRLEEGIRRAYALNDGIPPTYFRYHPTAYEEIGTTDDDGRPHIGVQGFEVEVLPLFLEGPVRALKVTPNQEEAQAIYQAVHDSALFDPKLRMYRLNASLQDQPMDIGRARAFPHGWLENGSIWMHMAYKYLLSLLKAGLYDAFFTTFKDGLIAFQDPAVYGRSILENSSFIASSTHPDASIHGQGFVARLSGSTAEFLSILHHMMVGPKPFYMADGDLCLAFKPVLPGWLFDDDGMLQFTFLGGCTVTYHNPHKRPLYGVEPPEKVTLETPDGVVELPDATIRGVYAEQVRKGQVQAITISYA